MIFITVSTGHFDPLIETCDKISSHSFLGQIGSGTYEPRFPHFRVAAPEVIEEQMRQAELVIAHAGTGTLTTLYRLKKPTIVIPKQVRYGETNDGQVELAEKWAELGMAILCMDVREIEKAIETCRSTSFQFTTIPRLGDYFSNLFQN